MKTTTVCGGLVCASVVATGPSASIASCARSPRMSRSSSSCNRSRSRSSNAGSEALATLRYASATRSPGLSAVSSFNSARHQSAVFGSNSFDCSRRGAVRAASSIDVWQSADVVFDPFPNPVRTLVLVEIEVRPHGR